MIDPERLVAEIEHQRRVTELAGPGRLAFELASQAYIDAHVPTRRDPDLANPRDAEAWLRGDGRDIRRAMGARRQAWASEQGERLA